jgi:hypothetical protein
MDRTRGPKLRGRRQKLVWDHCSKIMLCEPDAPKDEDNAMLDDVEPAGHHGCNHAQPLIRKEGLKLFTVYRKGKGDDEEGGGESSKISQPEKKALPAGEALQILKKMSDEDIERMGLSTIDARPEWMILSVFPVPPPPVRPGVAEGGAGKGEDDLTYKLADIIKASVQLKKFESEGAPAHIVSEFEDLLQFHCATYMDNDIAGVPQALQKTGRPVKAIRARLKGKEGRLRGNLMGKRVDFSARTVITGDPNLELDQVGVPKSIARNLTYPEKGEWRGLRRAACARLTRARSDAVQHLVPAGARAARPQRVAGRALRDPRQWRACRLEVQPARRHGAAVRLDRRAASQGRRLHPLQPPAESAQDEHDVPPRQADGLLDLPPQPLRHAAVQCRLRRR